MLHGPAAARQQNCLLDSAPAALLSFHPPPLTPLPWLTQKKNTFSVNEIHEILFNFQT